MNGTSIPLELMRWSESIVVTPDGDFRSVLLAVKIASLFVKYSDGIWHPNMDNSEFENTGTLWDGEANLTFHATRSRQDQQIGEISYMHGSWGDRIDGSCCISPEALLALTSALMRSERSWNDGHNTEIEIVVKNFTSADVIGMKTSGPKILWTVHRNLATTRIPIIEFSATLRAPRLSGHAHDSCSS